MRSIRQNTIVYERYAQGISTTSTLPGYHSIFLCCCQSSPTHQMGHLQVCQPWDPKKFNFQKALQQEVLFQYEPGLPSDGSLKFIAASPANNSPNLVLINVSPIEYGHVLLVPRVMDSLTQLVDQAAMRLALQFCEHSNNPYFRLCYNSLGAYGTINHLHFQVGFQGTLPCTAYLVWRLPHLCCQK